MPTIYSTAYDADALRMAKPNQQAASAPVAGPQNFQWDANKGMNVLTGTGQKNVAAGDLAAPGGTRDMNASWQSIVTPTDTHNAADAIYSNGKNSWSIKGDTGNPNQYNKLVAPDQPNTPAYFGNPQGATANPFKANAARTQGSTATGALPFGGSTPPAITPNSPYPGPDPGSTPTPGANIPNPFASKPPDQTGGGAYKPPSLDQADMEKYANPLGKANPFALQQQQADFKYRQETVPGIQDALLKLGASTGTLGSGAPLTLGSQAFQQAAGAHERAVMDIGVADASDQSNAVRKLQDQSFQSSEAGAGRQGQINNIAAQTQGNLAVGQQQGQNQLQQLGAQGQNQLAGIAAQGAAQQANIGAEGLNQQAAIQGQGAVQQALQTSQGAIQQALQTSQQQFADTINKWNTNQQNWMKIGSGFGGQDAAGFIASLQQSDPEAASAFQAGQNITNAQLNSIHTQKGGFGENLIGQLISGASSIGTAAMTGGMSTAVKKE